MSKKTTHSKENHSPLLTLITFIFATFTVDASLALKSKAIYGDDNRKDLHEVSDLDLVEAAKSTVALVSKTKLEFDKENNVYKVKKPTLLKSRINLCSSEIFSDQQSLAECSGFIIGENKVGTAQHCIQSQRDCDSYYFVIGFSIQDQNEKSSQEFPADSVFSCQSIHKSGEDIDFSILITDKIMNITPLKISDNTKLKTKKEDSPTNLVLIGHPSGLPLKISDEAQVSKIYQETFKANVDAFGGNSGSAILNEETLEIEGILVEGRKDYSYDIKKECYTRTFYEQDAENTETAVKASLLLPHL